MGKCNKSDTVLFVPEIVEFIRQIIFFVCQFSTIGFLISQYFHFVEVLYWGTKNEEIIFQERKHKLTAQYLGQFGPPKGGYFLPEPSPAVALRKWKV